jgi:hypothetical protein
VNAASTRAARWIPALLVVGAAVAAALLTTMGVGALLDARGARGFVAALRGDDAVRLLGRLELARGRLPLLDAATGALIEVGEGVILGQKWGGGAGGEDAWWREDGKKGAAARGRVAPLPASASSASASAGEDALAWEAPRAAAADALAPLRLGAARRGGAAPAGAAAGEALSETEAAALLRTVPAPVQRALIAGTAADAEGAVASLPAAAWLLAVRALDRTREVVPASAAGAPRPRRGAGGGPPPSPRGGAGGRATGRGGGDEGDD